MLLEGNTLSLIYWKKFLQISLNIDCNLCEFYVDWSMISQWIPMLWSGIPVNYLLIGVVSKWILCYGMESQWIWCYNSVESQWIQCFLMEFQCFQCFNVSIQVSSISMKGNSQSSKLLKESSLSSMQLHD